MVVCPPSKSQQVQESQLQKGVRTLYIMSSLWQKLCLNIGNSQRISQLITRKSGRRSQHDRVFNLDYPKVWQKPACIAHSNNSCFTCYIISKVCTPTGNFFSFTCREMYCERTSSQSSSCGCLLGCDVHRKYIK